ncbi:MAG: transporter substrate-binding domain-containing protein [Chloroflexota bacterium]
MTVRKRVVSLLAICFVVLMLPVFTSVAQDEPVKVAWPDLKGREVTIAMTNDYPPYQYYNDKKELIGWDYDTINDICALINCKPKFIETSWDGMLIAIAGGQFDVGAGGITYTAERAKSVDFTQLFQTYDETLLVRANETRFTTSAELKTLPKFRIGTQLATTNEISAQNIFGKDNVASYENMPAAILALQNNDVDAVQIDRPAAEGYIKAQGGIKTLAESLSGIEGLAFPMTKGSDLVAPFNAAISALQASGRWDDVFKKWFAPS